jgi:hypothetical protein
VHAGGCGRHIGLAIAGALTGARSPVLQLASQK